MLNGKAGSLNHHGYIVNAGDSLAIKGFRKDKHTEAAFQFADVADAYAAHSAQGDVRNIGVIGFAAFALQGKATNTLPPCSSQAFPADNNGYAPPPCRK
ncbi:membrane protein [Salmonella enterica subsp. enterica]|nr:membrane protein [Salmonella enterica subsp. enterica]